MTEYKNILIVRTDRIGDVVLTIPAIRALKKRYPNARITVLLAPLTVELVQGLSFVDEIMVDERKQSHKGVAGFIRLVKKIQSKDYDLAVIYHTKKRTNLACFLACIPVRIGYKNNKYGFLLNRPIVDNRHRGEKHEVRYCLDLLKELDVDSENVKLELPTISHNANWLNSFLEDKGVRSTKDLYLIHPSASDPAKQWPISNFSKLIDEITQKQGHSQFMIIGTHESKKLSADLIRATQVKIIDATGDLTIGQLMGLMAQSKMVISNDSGPVHIAAACETPVISIFTRNQPGINPQRWQPLGDKSRYVAVKPEGQLSFKKAQDYDPQNMEPIAVSEVLEAVDSLSKLC